jgi:hypothetical protein
VETPPYLFETVRHLMEKLKSFKAENERLMREQEKKTKINVVMSQSLLEIHRKL